jgi:hypothetical protein
VKRSFVSEAIAPALGSFDTAPLARGEPALPPEFTWRGETLTVARVLREWRSTKDDRGDTYLKRHWFEFETQNRRIATVYFERHPRSNEARWWLYTIGG